MAFVFPSISKQLRAIRCGDQDSWEFLCNTFKSGLIDNARLLLRQSMYRPQVSPEDVVQETLIRAWKNKEAFRGETTSQFSKWLLVILRNHFVDCCRRVGNETAKRAKHDHAIDACVVPGWGVETPSFHACQREDQSNLWAAVDCLNPREQLIVGLRVFDQMKFVEIAHVTKMNANTVAGIYRRSIEKLEQKMARN